MNRIYSISIIRAVACLMVVVLHSLLCISHLKNYNINKIVEIILQSGVDIFFFLSGFVMVYIYKEKQKVLDFIKKRILRIYPVYYEFTLFALLAYLFTSEMTERDIFASLFLIPGKVMLLLSVAWTLCYEVWFYLIFAICLKIFKNKFIYGIIIYALLTFLVHFFPIKLDNRFTILINSDLPFEFIIGALYCYSKKNKYILSIIFSIFIFLFFENYKIFIIMILTIIFFELLRFYEKYKKFPNFLILIGDSSYTIYLSHILIISIVKVFVIKFNLIFINDILIFLIMFSASLFFGLVHYQLVEKKLLLFLKRFVN